MRQSTVEEAWHWIAANAHPLPAENIPLTNAAGRVLAQDITSDVDVPLFERAMMDGYAVCAEDTQRDASLLVIGESFPGRPSAVNVEPGKVVRITTGAPLPAGANAVLPIERTQTNGDYVVVQEAVQAGKNVGRRGEDILAGTCVLSAGRLLRPQDLGVLSSIGVSEVTVIRSPRVSVVTTGNELLPPGSKPFDHRIVDANSPMLMALAERDGAAVTWSGIIGDSPEKILAAMQGDADVVLISGGSSVGQEDFAPRLLAQHGELAIHGVAMRPSRPAGMGRLENRLVFLLPGNPVSCLCAYDFFAGRAIRLLGGRGEAWSYRSVQLPLSRDLA